MDHEHLVLILIQIVLHVFLYFIWVYKCRYMQGTKNPANLFHVLSSHSGSGKPIACSTTGTSLPVCGGKRVFIYLYVLGIANKFGKKK